MLQKKPTAVFAVANWYGRQAYMAMRRLGLHFPEDISFLMFDDLQWTSMMAVDVVAQPIRTLAQALAEEAVSLIQNNALPGRTVFKPQLICRGSVRPLSGQDGGK